MNDAVLDFYADALVALLALCNAVFDALSLKNVAEQNGQQAYTFLIGSLYVSFFTSFIFALAPLFFFLRRIIVRHRIGI